MKKKKLVAYVTGHRNKVLDSTCSDRKDFNELIHRAQQIISDLESALIAQPNEYVNLKSRISNLKNHIRQDETQNKVKYLCRQIRRRILYDLRNIIIDNSQNPASENQKSN